jgi:hypothetical protein
MEMEMYIGWVYGVVEEVLTCAHTNFEVSSGSSSPPTLPTSFSLSLFFPLSPPPTYSQLYTPLLPFFLFSISF